MFARTSPRKRGIASCFGCVAALINPCKHKETGWVLDGTGKCYRLIQYERGWIYGNNTSNIQRIYSWYKASRISKSNSWYYFRVYHFWEQEREEASGWIEIPRNRYPRNWRLKNQFTKGLYFSSPFYATFLMSFFRLPFFSEYQPPSRVKDFLRCARLSLPYSSLTL